MIGTPYPRASRRRRALRFTRRWGVLLSALLLAACDDLVLSKEQRQLNDAIRQAIATDPSRINAPYADGMPPLHIALINHLPTLFDWLLKQGADPNAPDQRGETAVHKAVIFDSPDHRALRALRKRGADVNRRSDHGSAPLHVAALLSRASAVEALLAAGADPNVRDQLGEAPLHRAAAPQPTATAANVALTIHLLVAGGADVAAHKANGETPLHIAALSGSVLAIHNLLGEGAPVDVPGLGGGTALHVAATFARPEVAEVLLKAGAEPNSRDGSGRTPLGRALHYPATTSNAQRTGPVDTSAVVAVLRSYGAFDQDAPPAATDNAVSLEEFYRKLEKAEQLPTAVGNANEVSEARAFLDAYLRDPEKYGLGPGAIEQARAALALFRIDPNSEIAKSRLAELMDFIRESDDSKPDYLGIARGLASLGPKAEALYPALLLDALTDYEPENRRIAIRSLSKIIPSRKSLIASLKRIQVTNWDVDPLIANISPAEQELRAEIALALRHPYPSIRERAISVVGAIGSPDKIMLSALESLKSDPDARVRKKAVEAWRGIHKAE